MTHSAAMASEILIGKTILEALNTDLVCDAINTAMRELFPPDRLRPLSVRFLRGRPCCWLPPWKTSARVCAPRSGTMFATSEKGPRYMELTEGYVTRIALNKDDDYRL